MLRFERRRLGAFLLWLSGGLRRVCPILLRTLGWEMDQVPAWTSFTGAQCARGGGGGGGENTRFAFTTVHNWLILHKIVAVAFFCIGLGSD